MKETADARWQWLWSSWSPTFRTGDLSSRDRNPSARPYCVRCRDPVEPNLTIWTTGGYCTQVALDSFTVRCAAPWFSSTCAAWGTSPRGLQQEWKAFPTCVGPMSTQAPSPARQSAWLCVSVGSLILESLQFGAAFFAEGAQRIDRATAYQFAQLRNRFVRRTIRLNNHVNDCLRLFDHGRG
jgi:hypothetical protein